jgi:hypothetical protein
MFCRLLRQRPLAPEFTFSIPYDERLIRFQYLERCGTESERVEARQVEKVVENGDEPADSAQSESGNVGTS